MDLFLLLLLALFALLWWDGRRIHEIAVRLCKQACVEAGLQLLDDTVALRRAGLHKDENGEWRLRRVFSFEYNAGISERRQGYIVMYGKELTLLNLDPGVSYH